MASNRPTPEPLAVLMPKYEKRASYGPQQFNRLHSPGPPEHTWGGGSYDANGRGTKTRGKAPGYGAGASSNPGRHTLGGE